MKKEVYFSNLEWNGIKDTKFGGVKGNIFFKGGISYEEYNKLLKNTYYLICSKDYIISLEEENKKLKKENTEYQDEIFARDNSWFDMQD